MPFKRKSLLWFSLILYWVLVLILLLVSLLTTHGHFGYPIDDTYIHMAIARHFAEDGFWGVSSFGFSSSTSSPVWTFLIAITYIIFGVNDYSPFLLALIVGPLVIIYSASVLEEKLKPFHSKIFMAAVILLTPLAMLTLSGMEHLLHGLLTIILLFTASKFLENPQQNWKKTLTLALLAGTITLTRYEGLFLVFLICLFLLFQKRIVPSFVIGGAGLLPVIAYGMFSISKGWLFLPNSVILKGNSLQLSVEGLLSFVQRFFINIFLAPHVFILVASCVGIYFWGKKKYPAVQSEKYPVLLLGLTAYLHLQFASVGWFYRYDAYLVLAGTLVLARLVAPLIENINLAKNTPIKNVSFVSLGIILAMPLVIRAGLAQGQYPTAVKNIHDQQYQMGLFLHKYYERGVIAANDIGAINYLGNVKTLDLYGLGSLDVARARRSGDYDAAKVSELALKNGVEIIIIYDAWFEENRPPEWIEVGKWQITNNVVCADDVVTFYVTKEAFKSKAITSLQGFAMSLPADVVQSGAYLNP